MIFYQENHHHSLILQFHYLYLSKQFALFRFFVSQSQIFIKLIVPKDLLLSTRKTAYIVPYIILISIYHLWPNVPHLLFLTYCFWSIIFNPTSLTHHFSSIIFALYSPKLRRRSSLFWPSIISKNGLIKNYLWLWLSFFGWPKHQKFRNLAREPNKKHQC